MSARQLCFLLNDPNDENALMLRHSLIGGTMNSVPEPSLQDLPNNRLFRWQLIQKLKQHFCIRCNKARSQ